MRGICEGVEHHLWSSDSCPAYRVFHALRSSKLISWCTAAVAEGGGLLTEESKVKARWAGYFERLYQAAPPAVELVVRGVTIPITDPPINYDPPSFVEIQTAVKQLKCGKAPGICGIHDELLKPGGNVLLMSLHAVLCSVWSTGIIPADWKRGLIVYLEREG